MPSVLNDWVHDLSYMQQSVLLAMIRNADGIAKHHPQKELIKWFRRCILKSAFDGCQLHNPGEPGGGSFTGPVYSIEAALDSFIWARDEMTLHYFAHAMHAFEIMGYKYPDPLYRDFWHRAYTRCVDAMHMMPETEAQMDRRLCDNPETWMEREDKCGGCSSTERKDTYDPMPIALVGSYTGDGPTGVMGLACPGAVGVEGDPLLDDDIRNGERGPAEALGMRDADIYREVSQRMSDKTAVIDGKEVQLGECVQFDQDRAPIPLWARVRRSDNRFVNNATGLDLGNEFEIMWGHRKNEFSDYDETRDRVLPGSNEISPFADDERGKLHDSDAKGWNAP